MTIVAPYIERRIVCNEEEDYSFAINIFNKLGTNEMDEELLQAMLLYRPDTRFKDGDFALLMEYPNYLIRKFKGLVPRVWKIRMVITSWAWDLLKVASVHQGVITAKQAIRLLESQRGLGEFTHWGHPLIFATAFPQGWYPNSAAWIPDRFMRRLIRRQAHQKWSVMLPEQKADYRGYDTDTIRTNFMFDLEPARYQDGRDIGRPLEAEEAMVQTLYLSGLGPYMELPYKANEADRLPSIEEDHDEFADQPRLIRAPQFQRDND